ncbi:hypothetical protein ACQUQU_07535 [Thalassolituus sp. LLYu03]|uniref:hypothetical protein n=1 Tax=Thalassolituus sp. LLYu03 TaxID=3421656 RepID=UPI003D2C2C35
MGQEGVDMIFRLALFIWALSATVVSADVLWDIPVNKIGTITGKLYIKDLTVGDKAKIDKYSLFCTTKNNALAIGGYTEIGDGDYLVQLMPGNKITLTVPDAEEFIKKIFSDESYANCDWWTADKGASSVVIDSINGKNKLSELLKNP